ncbi:hypothetical protein [Thalassospira sp. MCCC 1A03138]|uniref:hypothetical protein n=1 Tax=Thalassospira sp. MCCC 1A03138 TaxID=1470576 RepID=UPI000A1F20E4|nr:hypothetical protein [Thalassospira sp. MCCC 1A03138]OSQ32247.1 hypothetical protein TH468_01000 [Thalassospira sp. MCCC 1A03138]
MTTRQAKRAPVDLPDTTRQWVSNDQAAKPAAFRRDAQGPVRPAQSPRPTRRSHPARSGRSTRATPEIIDIHKDCGGSNAFDIWPKVHLPRLVARLIAAIGTACVLFYLYSELARLIS